MLYVLQAENRRTNLFKFLLAVVKNQTEAIGGDYILEKNPVELGGEIAPKDSKYKANYAKFAMIQAIIGGLNEGDLILYLDSDIYVRQNGLQSLIDYIQESPKSIFYVTYVSKVASPIIGIKVSRTTKAVIGTMNTGVSNEFRKTAYGEALTSDEEIWHNAMDFNHMGIMEMLDVLPAVEYGAILQREMFGNDLPYIQATKDTKLVHFMSGSKDLAIDYIKQNDGVDIEDILRRDRTQKL